MATTHILLDMDGVLADFFTPALSRLNAHSERAPTPADTYRANFGFDMAAAFSITPEKFWQLIDTEDFWRKLTPLPHAKRLIAAVRGTGIPFFVASSPSMGYHCVPQKMAWLYHHLGIKQTQCMFGSAKHLMARPGALLIDDLDKNCDAFVGAGGSAVLLPSNWNKADIRFEEDIWSKIAPHLPL